MKNGFDKSSSILDCACGIGTQALGPQNAPMAVQQMTTMSLLDLKHLPEIEV